MAKKKKRKSYSRGGFKGLNVNRVIDGGIAGVGGQIAQRFLGPWGHPLATVAVGWWRKNETLQTEGARELGALIGQMLPVIGGGTSPYAGRNY